jgi:MFS family permease
MWIAAVERLMLLLLVGACVWAGGERRTFLLWAFFLCWGVMNFAMGMNLPGYFKLIAKTIPPEFRGRMYGIGGAVSGLLGVGAAFLAEWLLGRWGFPLGYAACFLAAFVAQSVTVIPLGFMREPTQEEDSSAEHLGPLRALQIGRGDSRLMWLCGAVALFGLNQMANGFYTIYAVHHFGGSPATVAKFTAVLMGARVVANLLIGWIADRRGNRIALQVSTAAGIGAAGLALGAPDLTWLYAVFALNEVAVQGWGVCSMNYVLELCPPERSGTYTAVYGLLTGPFRVALPLCGGAIIALTGYTPVFAAAVVGSCLALALLTWRVPEPRDETGRDSGVVSPTGTQVAAQATEA